ncbi:MAG: GNAT family N-acetyltransferase [Flavobacteriaceae bacterium]
MIHIQPATSLADYKCISKLAHTIWHEHYITIISIEQIEYMLEKYNSVKSIEKSAKEGILFFYMTFDDVPVGYIAIEKETDFIYISKLYVLKSYRGKKIAKTALLFAESLALEEDISTMKLHVNKYNKNSISAYEKMGFVNTESSITDIGKGFVMDDYLMVKMI